MVLPSVGEKFLEARDCFPRRDGVDGNAEKADSVHAARIPQIPREDSVEYRYTPPVNSLRSIATGALLIALAACTVQSQDILEDVTDGSSSSASSASASAEIGERMLEGGILEIGSASAPVTMSLSINHDSPYSRQFHALMPILERNYVSTGKLKIDVFTVAFEKYPDSVLHARKLICAGKQGKGRLMHDLLMSGSELSLPAGTDKAAFDLCLNSDETTADIIAQGEASNTGEPKVVPTYVINGKTFTGVPTEADLLGAIRSAL